MSWGDDVKNPVPDWMMSVSLENVTRAGQRIAEVTSLHEAVRTWHGLDGPDKGAAVLTLERPITIDGALCDRLEGHGIAVLVERLDTAKP